MVSKTFCVNIGKGFLYITCLIFLVGCCSKNVRPEVRTFYLSTEGVTGKEANDICGNDFHMASLWEIYSLSLRYNHELGYNYEGDVGNKVPNGMYGPPMNAYGWIMNGELADTANSGRTPGKSDATCLAWNSESVVDNGTLVKLDPGQWNIPQLGTSSNIHPFRSRAEVCSNKHRTWCVSD